MLSKKKGWVEFKPLLNLILIKKEKMTENEEGQAT